VLLDQPVAFPVRRRAELNPQGFRSSRFERGAVTTSASSSMSRVGPARQPVGTPDRNRTCNTWIRNPVLCPLSYRGMVPPSGVEPPAFALSERRPYHSGHGGIVRRAWWLSKRRRRESNPRPPARQAGALTTELRRRVCIPHTCIRLACMGPATRTERAPPPYEAGALPSVLHWPGAHGGKSNPLLRLPRRRSTG
jgi:hypothetical protein